MNLVSGFVRPIMLEFRVPASRMLSLRDLAQLPIWYTHSIEEQLFNGQAATTN